MGIRWYEWKKLMCHSGGLLIVVAFVLLEIFRLIISHGSGLAENKRHRTFYEQYLSYVVGKVDEETTDFFSERNEEFSRAAGGNPVADNLPKIFFGRTDGRRIPLPAWGVGATHGRPKGV